MRAARSRSTCVAATTRTFDRRLLRRADRPHHAALEHAQEARLQRLGQLADLVEEQRAAVGLPGRSPMRRASAPVKAPRSCPNISLSIEILRQRAAVDRDELRRAARSDRAAPAPRAPCPSRSRRGSSTGIGTAASRAISARIFCIGADSPTISASTLASMATRSRVLPSVSTCPGRMLRRRHAHAIEQRPVRRPEIAHADALSPGSMMQWRRDTHGSSRRTSTSPSVPIVVGRSIA